MDPELRSELDRLALEVLRQDANHAAFQLAVIEALDFNEEHLETFLTRYSTLQRLQMTALIERVRALHPRQAEMLASELRRK
jgi:hypothetical protein